MIKQNLVEQHIIKKSDPQWGIIDEASFEAKNLYNKALYEMRQQFFATRKNLLGLTKKFFKLSDQLHWSVLCNDAKSWAEFKALPAKVSQLIVKKAFDNIKAFIQANNAYHKNGDGFTGQPKLPRYKHKETGRFPLYYNAQAISRKELRCGFIVPSRLGIQIKTKQYDKKIVEVRVIPKVLGHYVIEIVYEIEHEEFNENLDYSLIAGIDLGVGNLAVVTSNKNGLKPFIVNGKAIKSVNQWFNKQVAKLKAGLAKWCKKHHLPEKRSSRKIQQMTHKRNLRIKHMMHVASRRIVDILLEEQIGTIVIGNNQGWKQQANLGKRNNQNFVSIPYANLINMITYKAKMLGIQVFVVEESYTSNCSFFDGEFPQKQTEYAGERISRGLFRTSDGIVVNADINASYNIIQKAFWEDQPFQSNEMALVFPDIIQPF